MKVAVIVLKRILLIFILVLKCFLPRVQCMTLTNFSELPYHQLLSTERANPTGIKEAIVIPTNDPYEEAQRLYNEALQQFGATMKTMKEVCGTWEQRGCLCSGSAEKTTLNCRGQRVNVLPADFPETLIKL